MQVNQSHVNKELQDKLNQIIQKYKDKSKTQHDAIHISQAPICTEAIQQATQLLNEANCCQCPAGTTSNLNNVANKNIGIQQQPLTCSELITLALSILGLASEACCDCPPPCTCSSNFSDLNNPQTITFIFPDIGTNHVPGKLTITSIICPNCVIGNSSLSFSFTPNSFPNIFTAILANSTINSTSCTTTTEATTLTALGTSFLTYDSTGPIANIPFTIEIQKTTQCTYRLLINADLETSTTPINADIPIIDTGVVVIQNCIDQLFLVPCTP